MWYLAELTLIAIISINVSSAEVANELTVATTDQDTSSTDVAGLVESMIFKGATSRITQLEKAGKFFQVWHS